MQEKVTKPTTLRRDGKGPLKFNGERIGDASRQCNWGEFEQEEKTYETSARLFRTTSGKYVLGIETYNRTDECYDSRGGWVSDSLQGLLEQITSKSEFEPEGRIIYIPNFVDNDLLAEVFEKTEIADQFVEKVD